MLAFKLTYRIETMISLREAISWALENKVALGHFNVSDLEMLQAVVEAAKELSLGQPEPLPIIIGVSEGEREALGVLTISRLVKGMAKDLNYPLFLNADHTKSIEKIEEAARAGFDAVIFDGADLSLEENLKKTKEAAQKARAINKNIIVEGELGYIGSGSEVRTELPKGAAVTIEQATKVDEAVRFVKETGVDLFAPAVGNVHGMLKDSPDPRLFIDRVGEIFKATGVPLVLHGGSGTVDEDFVAAIKSGVAIIHISTELRKAWREGVEQDLKNKPNEVAPYKLLEKAKKNVGEVVMKRLRLFNSL